ncbi:hypothetical protein B0H10DRAFT_2245560 [Mycena sp. CBHHK59/15]|nr:hypothetical protein B0H10DRAFT_2245560 [Mycena sp. CBHHK59/15]
MWPTFPIFLFSSRDAPHVATTHTGNSAVPSNLNEHLAATPAAACAASELRPIELASITPTPRTSTHERSPYCVTLFVLLVALRPLRVLVAWLVHRTSTLMRVQGRCARRHVCMHGVSE